VIHIDQYRRGKAGFSTAIIVKVEKKVKCFDTINYKTVLANTKQTSEVIWFKLGLQATADPSHCSRNVLAISKDAIVSSSQAS